MSVTSIAKKSANYEVPKMVSASGVVYTVETITPAQAKEWLALNTDNRKFRRPVGEKYARDMGNGKWAENGTTVCFAEDGTLLDGQHRLWGCVKSNRAIISVIVRNLPAETQDTMDDLAKRTLADTFGFHSIQNQHTASAIVRRVLMWENGYRTNRGGYQVTKSESLQAWRTDPTLPVAVEAAIGMKRRKLVPASIVGLTYWIFSNIDADDCEGFWNALHTGESLTADSPIYILREQIARYNSRAESGRIAETLVLAWIIKAWNHFRAGKSLSPSYTYSLKSSERMPEPK